jgi:hypothetical protein
MAIGSDFTLDYVNKKISHTSGTTRYTVNELYSWLMDVFDDPTQMDDTIPMEASTPTEYSLVNSWVFNADSDLSFLYGGSISIGGGATIWANFYTLGTIVATDVVYWMQNGATIAAYTGYVNGHIDQLIKVKNAGSLIDSGKITAFVRNLGNLYDFFEVTATSTGGRNPIPLATSVDSNDDSSTATDGGITITFGTVSRDTGIGGPQNYSVVVDGQGTTCAQLYKYLKYQTRRQNGSAIGTGNAILGCFYQQAVGTAVKVSPFGTFAGGKFFGAQGVWITNVSDAGNIAEVYDTGGTKRTFPSVLSVVVSGVVSGDRVFVARSSGGIVDKNQFTIASVSASTIVATESIPMDISQTGIIRAGDVQFTYTSWAGSTFQVTTSAVGKSGGFYIPLIDASAVSTSISSPSITYLADFPIIARVRKKGILPFENTGIVGRNGLTVSAIRTTDNIAV